MEEDYAGQSLGFIRRLLGAPPKWPTARDAAKALTLSQVDPPPLRAVCFYGSKHWGHCGLYVTHGMALTVAMDGESRLFPYDIEHYWDGPFLGWVSAQDFLLASTRQEANDG